MQARFRWQGKKVSICVWGEGRSFHHHSSSQAGREDWIAVRLIDTAEGFHAEPIFGRSNLIFTLASADGLIRIPADANGLETGSQVDVWLI